MVLSASALAVMAGLSACGTRLPDHDFTAAAVEGGSSSAGPAASNASGPGVGSSGPGAPGAGTAGQATGSGPGVGSGGAGGPGTAVSGGGPGGGASNPVAGHVAVAGASSGATDVGVTSNSITLGNITAINGALGPYAFGVTLPGLETWVDATNAQGGINGRKIVLDTCDDSADGQQNLACTTRLVSQDHVFALLGNNTDACASSAHYEYTQGVPDIGFPLCNGYYMYPNMFSIYGTGYPRNAKLPAQQESQAGVYQWLARQRHVSKGAFFFYIIPVSQQAGYGEEAGALSAGISTAYEGGGNHEGENPANPTFDTDVINMRAAHVDVIFDAIDTAGNAKLCSAMDRQGYTVTVKASTVEVYGQAVGQWSQPCRDSVYASDGSASYSNTTNPVVAQFRRYFSDYQPNGELHQWALDGYGLGLVLGDAVRSMGANVTRAGLVKWLDAWTQPQAGGSGYTYDGLSVPLSWQPQNFHAPAPSCTSIAQWQEKAGSFVEVAGTNSCYELGWLTTPFSADGS